MPHYSLGLCLFDFVPNVAFGVGAFFLVRMARIVLGRRCAWPMTGGVLLVFFGGLLKAIWKLLYASGLGDVRVFSEAQFVLLAPGFLLVFTSMVMCMRSDRRGAQGDGQQTVLALAIWKIPFLIVTTLCSIGAYGLLSYMAFRKGTRLAAVLFIVAVLCLLGMSGMASGEQTVARQWIEQSVNSAGQAAFALGSFLLYCAVRRR
jgi:hypothetical protein